MEFQEGERLELKQTLSDEKEVLKTVTAFANTAGGKLIVGVNDKGKVVGIDIGDNTIENISRKITELITPPIYPKIYVDNIEGKRILVIEVNESELKPHFYKNIAYVRVGKINKPLSLEKLLEMLKKRLTRESFDQQPNKYAKISDIDEKSVIDFVKRMGKRFKGLRQTLESLKLIREGSLLNASILFFGKEPSLLFPLYGIKCALFKGNEVFDMKVFEDNIMRIIDKAFSYVIEKIPKKIVIEGTIRKEKPLIPEEAIREAIVNAVIHRDYTYPSSIFISIFEDRIVIKNPGMLRTLSIEDLYKEHISEPRNPLLAELAYRAGFIEQWGTGTLRIIRATKLAGLKTPEFSNERGFFTTTLFMSSPQLNEKERKILRMAINKGRFTFRDVRKNIKGVSDRMLRKYISKLVKEGFLFRKGRGKNSYYTIIS